MKDFFEKKEILSGDLFLKTLFQMEDNAADNREDADHAEDDRLLLHFRCYERLFFRKNLCRSRDFFFAVRTYNSIIIYFFSAVFADHFKDSFQYPMKHVLCLRRTFLCFCCQHILYFIIFSNWRSVNRISYVYRVPIRWPASSERKGSCSERSPERSDSGLLSGQIILFPADR